MWRFEFSVGLGWMLYRAGEHDPIRAEFLTKHRAWRHVRVRLVSPDGRVFVATSIGDVVPDEQQQDLFLRSAAATTATTPTKG